jgi:hypothetical protein
MLQFLDPVAEPAIVLERHTAGMANGRGYFARSARRVLGVASGPMSAGSAFMLLHLIRC